jgi:hypothetical protein
MAAAGVDNVPGQTARRREFAPARHRRAEGAARTRPCSGRTATPGPCATATSSWSCRLAKSPGAPALFDLAADIGETKDLAADRKDDVARLQGLYNAWKATHQPTPWRGKGGQEVEESGEGQDETPGVRNKAG